MSTLSGLTLFDTLTQSLLDGLATDIAQDSDPQLLAHRADPLHWFSDVLGIDRRTFAWSEYGGRYADENFHWDGTVDPLAAASAALAAGHSVGVESATGTGKTFWAAGMVLWFLDCWRKSVVVTIAPREDQLKLNLWKEIGQMFPRFRRRRPTAELTSLTLKMQPPGHKWAAVGLPVGVGADEAVATKAQGFHEKDMLIISEETPGIKGAVMAAFEQTSVAPHNLRLALGNPDHREDTLHRFCISPGITHIRISALDHPNVVLDDPLIIPGAVSQKSIDERRKKYGEGSAMYRSRVQGISPAQSADSLIQLSWLLEARDRGLELCKALGIPNLEALLYGNHPELPAKFAAFDGERAAGVDVANSENGDLAALAKGRGAILCSVQDEQCADANAYARMRVMQDCILGLGIDPDYIGVDGVGVGSGAVNELLGQGYPIQNLIGGASPDLTQMGEEEFLNLRAQMHWRFRLDAQYGRLILSDDEDLFRDLTTPTWQQPADRKIRVEAKEHLKGRLPGKRSPNKGDAAVYWNWVRQVRAGFNMDSTAGNVSF